ncbi:bifunctional peptide chain release factor N(5)-glutamine methyltransferase PrmC/tRNA (guanosine(46)-N7)-methyltransferase TrmB [Rickettsia endosymbiont of Halotydeus destructor]|uniref:bifunctional peptide chain release factor N(5)-glutamine methyltransferase PrmC/tRNA (guanosine(46)-N7)-methyltransferase TrmB n=1 Tax=Rickettsia endosymbiont of Halotydeus destructor TaxID=2996754 RepID=UPI003BAF6C51
MTMSIQQCLNKAAYKLQKIGINSPQLEARILLQYVIGKPLEYLLTHADEQLIKASLEAFKKLLERRLKHEPIAYITGFKEFYSREFIVTKHVLIPRADTELLVDIAIQCHSRLSQCHSRESRNPEKTHLDSVVKPRNDNILELGTGSGCIAITLLLELPNSTVVATDISLDAIGVAKNNALKHQVSNRIKIIHSDWFENIEDEKFDFIVSNPPYISNTEKSEMAVETINYEPHPALFAEQEGLQAYYIIAQNAKRFLKRSGKLIIEIGYLQAEVVSKIFIDYGYIIDHVCKDLQGHSRVLVISYPNLNRSYARRIGKSLSSLQQNLLDTELPKHLFSPEKIKSEKRKIFLEIGFGMGEHFIHQAKNNPEALFIGAEVYLNGVANALKLAQEQNVTNFLLWPNNLDLILYKLPNKILEGIYILFPDPWPKNKQKKKRILNKERLNILQSKLKTNGSFVFASDIEDYFNETLKLIQQNPNFKIINSDYSQPHDNYIITKYHQKAINEGRKAKFIKATVSL